MWRDLASRARGTTWKPTSRQWQPHPRPSLRRRVAAASLLLFAAASATVTGVRVRRERTCEATVRRERTCECRRCSKAYAMFCAFHAGGSELQPYSRDLVSTKYVCRAATEPPAPRGMHPLLAHFSRNWPAPRAVGTGRSIPRRQAVRRSGCGPTRRSTQIAGHDRNIECGEKVRRVWGKRAFCGLKVRNAGRKELIPPQGSAASGANANLLSCLQPLPPPLHASGGRQATGYSAEPAARLGPPSAWSRLNGWRVAHNSKCSSRCNSPIPAHLKLTAPMPGPHSAAANRVLRLLFRGLRLRLRLLAILIAP